MAAPTKFLPRGRGNVKEERLKRLKWIITACFLRPQCLTDLSRRVEAGRMTLYRDLKTLETLGVLQGKNGYFSLKGEPEPCLEKVRATLG